MQLHVTASLFVTRQFLGERVSP